MRSARSNRPRLTSRTKAWREYENKAIAYANSIKDWNPGQKKKYLDSTYRRFATEHPND